MGSPGPPRPRALNGAPLSTCTERCPCGISIFSPRRLKRCGIICFIQKSLLILRDVPQSLLCAKVSVLLQPRLSVSRSRQQQVTVHPLPARPCRPPTQGAPVLRLLAGCSCTPATSLPGPLSLRWWESGHFLFRREFAGILPKVTQPRGEGLPGCGSPCHCFCCEKVLMN